MSEPQWHYFHDRMTEGPMSEANLCELMRTGRVPRDVLVWNEKLGEWKSATAVPCFQGITSTPSPANSILPSKVTPAPSAAPQLFPLTGGTGTEYALFSPALARPLIISAATFPTKWRCRNSRTGFQRSRTQPRRPTAS